MTAYNRCLDWARKKNGSPALVFDAERADPNATAFLYRGACGTERPWRQPLCPRTLSHGSSWRTTSTCSIWCVRLTWACRALLRCGSLDLSGAEPQRDASCRLVQYVQQHYAGATSIYICRALGPGRLGSQRSAASSNATVSEDQDSVYDTTHFHEPDGATAASLSGRDPTQTGVSPRHDCVSETSATDCSSRRGWSTVAFLPAECSPSSPLSLPSPTECRPRADGHMAAFLHTDSPCFFSTPWTLRTPCPLHLLARRRAFEFVAGASVVVLFVDIGFPSAQHFKYRSAAFSHMPGAPARVDHEFFMCRYTTSCSKRSRLPSLDILVYCQGGKTL